METLTTTQPSLSPTVSAEVPINLALSTPAPASFAVRHKAVLNRRIVFTFVLVLLVALSGGGIYYYSRFLASTPIPQAMFGFDTAHTNDNPYEHTLNPGNVSRLTPLWSFPTGGHVESSPVIADGMIYVGSNDHKLYAFDASCRKSCQPLWTFATGGWIFSSPAVAGDMVYIGSFDHNLYAFDASCRHTCQPLWTFSAGDRIVSSPAVAGGVVYVGSFDNSLYAFDASCRKACLPLWSFPTRDRIHSSPVVANGIIYVGSFDHNLYAFGLAT